MNEFDNIYKNRGWGYSDNETLSGCGSTKSANKYRNQFLATFINENDIHLIFDICGDCNWQSGFMELLTDKKAKYYGFDVSNYALNLAKQKNKSNPQLTFSDYPIDLCETELLCNDNEKSIIIVKEVIQHLPLQEGMKMLKNIKKSGIKYIAITNYDYDFFDAKNENVKVGGFYYNNVLLSPFNFKNPLKDVSDIIVGDINKMEYGNFIIFNIQEQDIS